MRGVLLAALVGSLLIHLLALFGIDVAWFGNESEPVVLQAELRPPPPPPAADASVVVPQPRPKPPPPKPRPAPTPIALPAAVAEPPVVAETAEEEAEPAADDIFEADPPSPEVGPPALALPASGAIRFAIIKESLGLQVGRAEHHWEFTDDGSYLLRGVSETSGLVAVFRPVQMVLESRGRLVAGGLRPESFRSRRDGRAAEEGADFDWAAGQLRLLRDGSTHRLTPGAQDILSLNYQLAYLGELAEGVGLGVATSRWYEWQQIDALGEEEIEVPAGHFRTLHLRAMTDSTTEIWIALDHGRLPVKIRFTDKKGDSFEQVATDLEFEQKTGIPSYVYP
ncbi:MAG: DUF3108 domain-containing protein [Azonexus sp.]|jgi:hypothetical protein|uniref:DUF3108 domain-containing protein n=1 Tax=Azonexus sp. TaxID=1872668 RepID=UPI00282DAC24|nr:DUF3108 domain-containing protein [Azonexus sp.]MDR0776792.1 DUF3108 domain-containing protein [Azonexus sp.]